MSLSFDNGEKLFMSVDGSLFSLDFHLYIENFVRRRKRRKIVSPHSLWPHHKINQPKCGEFIFIVFRNSQRNSFSSQSLNLPSESKFNLCTVLVLNVRKRNVLITESFFFVSCSKEKARKLN